MAITGQRARPDGRGPKARFQHRGPKRLTELQGIRRRKVTDRIEVVNSELWLWTGQSKLARGHRYPQIMHSLEGGLTQLMNARHVIFYLATGWVPEGVQQYRTFDRDPMNVHPDNLVPMPPRKSKRATNNFWDTDRLRDYYG